MINILRLRLEPLSEDRMAISVQAWPIGQFSLEGSLPRDLLELQPAHNRKVALEQGRLLSQFALGASRQRFLSMLDELCKGLEQPSLCVESSQPEFLALPWEFLECSPGMMLLSDRRIPVYRSLGEAVRARVLERPRLLLASANPTQTRYARLVEADAEIAELATRMREFAEVRTVRGVTRDELIASISQFKPHMFHFVGHGSRKGIVLEGPERGRSAEMDLEELGPLLGDSNTVLVNLSCCSGESGAEVLLRHGVHACVSGSGEVQDSTHRAMVCRFYEALGVGERVDRALGHAQWHTNDFNSMWRLRLYLRGAPFSMGVKQDGAPEIFVGRPAELGELKRLLLDEVAPLVPVVGLGGAGKTTLIREFMSIAGAAYERVIFLDCSAFGSFDQVLGALAKEIDVTSPNDLFAALSELRTLVCLDAFEGVLSNGPPAISSISPPGTQILISSRVWRQIGDENILSLGGLNDDEAASELFRKWCFKLGAEPPNEHDASAIVGHLHGYPLALVIAAGRLKDLSPTDLLNLLKEGSGSFLADVQSVLNQALSLIAEQELRLLQRLSLFSGWFSLSDCGAILNMSLADLAEKVADLKRKGLVVDRDGHSTCKVLDPVREWIVGAVLTETGSLTSIEDQTRFCDRYIAHAEGIRELLEESRWSEARERLWLHLPNFRRALSIAYERREWRTVSAFVRSLTRLLFELGVWPEFELLLEAGNLAAKELEDSDMTATLLGLQGAWEARTGRYRECYRTWERRAQFARDQGLVRHEVDSLLDLGAQFEQDSNFPDAATMLRQAHALSATLDDPSTLSNVQVILARHCQRMGNNDEAHQLVASASELAASAKADIAIRVFLNVSRYHRDQGELDQAELFMYKALSSGIDSGHPYILSTLLVDCLKLNSLKDDCQLTAAICAALILLEAKVKSRLRAEAMRLIASLTGPDPTLNSIVEELVQQPQHVSLNIVLERLRRRS